VRRNLRSERVNNMGPYTFISNNVKPLNDPMKFITKMIDRKKASSVQKIIHQERSTIF
jgi:hypothetical protein